LPFAQEPSFIKPFDFSLLSNDIDEYFGNCGAIQSKDDVSLPEDLNAVILNLGENFQNADLSDCSQCLYGIQSHQGVSLDMYYKQINATISKSTIENRGHVDEESQSTVTENQDLVLWYCRPAKNPPNLRVSDDHMFRPITEDCTGKRPIHTVHSVLLSDTNAAINSNNSCEKVNKSSFDPETVLTFARSGYQTDFLDQCNSLSEIQGSGEGTALIGEGATSNKPSNDDPMFSSGEGGYCMECTETSVDMLQPTPCVVHIRSITDLQKL
jgi:hypothetical protein